MKKKWFLTALTAGLLTMSLTTPVFAAEWKQDETGWWYQNDDGSYLKDGWNWIDGRCYYFDRAGYCLLDTVTPDGYTVDASGAWTVDGVVQVQKGSGEASAEESETAAAWTEFADQGGTQMTVGSLTFTVPGGFMKADALSSETTSYFVNSSMDAIVGIVSEEIPDVYGYEGLVDAMGEYFLATAMQTFGTIDEKTTHTFGTGTWYRYRYADADAMGVPGQLYAYGRIQNARLEMVVFAGNIAGIDMSGIMNQNLQ